MNCGQAKSLLSEYIDCTLDDGTGLRLEAHLAICGRCSDELEGVRSMVQSLRGLAVASSPRPCWPAIVERLPDVRPRAPWFARPLVAVPALALGLLLAVAAFLPWVNMTGPRPRTLTATHYTDYIGAHYTAQMEQPLADADVAFINAELQTASISGE